MRPLSLLLLITLLAACTPDPDTTRQDFRAQTAHDFFQRNRLTDFTPFAGVAVRLSQPVLKQDVTVLGYTYAISFCHEVEDVTGQRGSQEHVFYYSDWPARQHEIRRAGITPEQRRFLQQHFRVRDWEAEGAFVTWAEEIIDQFKALNAPHAFAPPPRYLRALTACTTAEGPAVRFWLASGVEVDWLSAPAEASAYWQREAKTLHRLAPHWYWR